MDNKHCYLCNMRECRLQKLGHLLKIILLVRGHKDSSTGILSDSRTGVSKRFP